MTRHVNVTLRDLLEAWQPSLHEMTRLETDINDTVFKRSYPIALLLMIDDGYFVRLDIHPTQKELKGIAKLASHRGLKLLPQSMQQVTSYLSSFGAPGATGALLRSLVLQGKLYRLVK